MVHPFQTNKLLCVLSLLKKNKDDDEEEENPWNIVGWFTETTSLVWQKSGIHSLSNGKKLVRGQFVGVTVKYVFFFCFFQWRRYMHVCIRSSVETIDCINCCKGFGKWDISFSAWFMKRTFLFIYFWLLAIRCFNFKLFFGQLWLMRLDLSRSTIMSTKLMVTHAHYNSLPTGVSINLV